jgi:hypothetical protein
MRGWEVADIRGDAAKVVSAVVMGCAGSGVPWRGADGNGKGGVPR